MPANRVKGFVAVIGGSESDREVVKRAEEVLDRFGVPYETRFLSSHRQHRQLEKYVAASKADIFIAVAGMAAHLAGFLASLTVKPVIGVPVSSKLGGLDALLSTVQMPRGVPVACVGVDQAANAALLALEILALRDQDLVDKLSKYRAEWK